MINDRLILGEKNKKKGSLLRALIRIVPGKAEQKRASNTWRHSVSDPSVEKEDGPAGRNEGKSVAYD